MDPFRLDSFSKKLSTISSRRDVVRLFGAALTAGSLAARFPAGAVAAGHGNSACAHFCAAVFGADTPEAGQCTSDAAHGGGLCYECGPNANPNDLMVMNGACASICPNGGFCGGNGTSDSSGCTPGCGCAFTAEQQNVCITPPNCGPHCETTSDCPIGSVCIVLSHQYCNCGGTGSTEKICAPLCA